MSSWSRALALSFVFAAGASPVLADCKVGIIASLPVTMEGMKPMVPAKINGADVNFIADSGAFYSEINTAKATELGLRTEYLPYFRVRGVGGAAETYLTTVKTFTLANVPIPRVEFLVTAGVGGEAAGLLGQNVLGLADVEYDFAHGAIRLMKAKDCSHVALAYWAGGGSFSAMDIKAPEPNNPHTIGIAQVNGANIKVAFDTGAGTSVMTLAAAKRAGLKLDAPGVEPGGASWGLGRHMARAWIVPVSSFKIGDEEIRNTKMRVADIELDDWDMLLGADFFLSHRVYVSNSQRKLYFSYSGGPVFDMTAHTLAQEGKDGVAKESKVEVDNGPEPKDAEGFSRRGAALASRREYDRAIADFDRACALAPTEARYFVQRANAYLADNQTEKGKADLDRALKLQPTNLDALVMRANLRLLQKDEAGAAIDVDAAAKAAPKEADMRMELAQLYNRMDRLDAAVGQIDLWVPLHDDDARLPFALNERCWDLALLGRDLDKALKDCDRAVGRAKNAAHLDSRGMVHLRRGEFEKAVADYDAALKLQPKIAWSLYGRGLAKQRLGQQADGQKDIDAAVAIEADLPKKARDYGILQAAPAK